MHVQLSLARQAMTIKFDNDTSCALNDAEVTTYNRIRETILGSFPSSRVIANVILPLEQSSEVSIPASTEYDTIAVTPYGLIVFECKGWRGDYLYKDEQDQWMLRFDDTGRCEHRRNAISQCFGKTRHLQTSTGYWTSSFVVMSNPKLRIAHNIGAHVVSIQEIDYIPRLVYHFSKRQKNAHIDDRTLNIIADAILENAGQISKEEHYENIMRHVSNNHAKGSVLPTQ